MIRKELILDIHDELIVDNFAGGGGASTGIERALGRHVNHAINHDWAALGMHRINHAQTVHHCEDVFEVNPAVLTEGRRVGMGWFSPDCKHFSKAKGGKPLSKKIRGLAFVILRWAKIRTRVIYMENVEEIQTWGPLLANGKPDPAHKGRTWRAFLAALSTGVPKNHPDLAEMLEVLGDSVTREELVRGFGYAVETRELRACDYGAPTIRKRLFLVARCDGLPIVWPKPTHADPKGRGSRVEGRGLKPWRAVAECIDWTIPCNSIFLNQTEAKAAKCRRPLAHSTLRRIATGIDRYVLKAKKLFLVSLTHQGGERVEAIDEPVRTLTGAHRGEKGLVVPHVERFQGDHAGRSDGTTRNLPLDKPLPTQDTSNRFARVDASVAPFVSEHANASKNRNMPADEPMRTICAGVKGGHFSVVSSALVHTAHGEVDKNGKKRGRGSKPITEPLPSVLASPDCSLMAAHLTKFTTGSTGAELTEPAPTVTAGSHSPETRGGAASTLGIVGATLIGAGGRAAQSRPRGINESLHTITSKADTCLASATIVGAGGPSYSGKPVPVYRPFKSQVTENHSALAAASMVKLRGTTEAHLDSSAGSAGEPIDTISAAGTHHGLVMTELAQVDANPASPRPSPPFHGGEGGGLKAAYLAQHNGGFNTTPGHEAEEPISTISQKGSQQQVVTGSLAAYYGNDEDGQAVDESLRTVTTKERFGFVKSSAVGALGAIENGDRQDACPTLTPEQIIGARRVSAFLREYGVQFEGEFATVAGYVIVDIGMRMLTARELFLAQGFPGDYVIDKAWVVDPETGGIKEMVLTKEQQIRMCGNSVSPPVAKALIAANSGDLAIWEGAERKRFEKYLAEILGTTAASLSTQVELNSL